MPRAAVPAPYRGRPKRELLPAGTKLSRVHSFARSPSAFSERLADLEAGGGRFDATVEDPYGFLYACTDDGAAVCETLLRDLPPEPSGGRLLPMKAVEGRALGRIETSRELTLVRLIDAADLGAVGQDIWLVQSPSKDYPLTRRWGHAIRRIAPWCQGFVWRSRREPRSLAYIFFSDRQGPVSSSPFDESASGNPSAVSLSFETAEGEAYLREILVRYSVALSSVV